jgi:hypothetical protein
VTAVEEGSVDVSASLARGTALDPAARD